MAAQAARPQARAQAAGAAAAAVPAPAPPAPPPPHPAEPAFQLLQSKRGGEKLLHQGFLYNLRYAAKNGTRTWCCEKGPKVCGGEVKTRLEGLRTVIQQVKLHTHLPTPDKAVAEQVRAKARAAASQQPDTTAANVVSAALTGVAEESLSATPNTRNLKRTCWRTRAAEQQKRIKSGEEAPQDFDYSTLDVLTVPDKLKKVDGEEFLAFDSGPAAGENRIQVWACKKNLDFLSLADVWLADGTFRMAPAPFLQVYTVHGYQNGYVVPCCYILLADKKQATYKRAWGALFRLLAPEEPEVTLLVDYEKASYQAASAIFLEVNIGGCYFHFRAAVHKHVVFLGLGKRYGDNVDFRLRVGKLCALAFLPAESVADWFETLATEFPNEELELLTYFEKTWVGEKPARARVRKAPVFPVDLWNVHHRALDKKFLTTNAAELFHRHHAAQFHKGAHPFYPTFIESLHKQQRLTNRDITEIAIGGEKKLRESTRVRGDKQCNLVNKYLADSDGMSLVMQMARLAMSED